MPSYYDSTKKKPGKAKVVYNKGGKVKKMSDGGKTVTTEDRIRDAQIKKELQERIALLRREGKFQRMSAADRAARAEKEEADWAAGIDIEEKRHGGKVKKMKGGGTVARGSGAARPQTFRKNG